MAAMSDDTRAIQDDAASRRRKLLGYMDDKADALALRVKVAENRISEPHDPGDFVGDIFYGHPIKTTMGTHRWTGTEWVALPSEAEALAGLLAEARKEAAALRERVARLGALAQQLIEMMDWTGTGDSKSGDRERAKFEEELAALTDALTDVPRE